ncbi:hypothetical protein COL940_011646 [Colletotrichum noveboracense]|nr:hypothetical protein COL940_011646 [Colletotrichum noveboracense]KAJ0270522.1 hypothetical protein CBS470a_013490 [Colletotrichum nupharicola]
MKFINALFLFATLAAAVPAGNANEPVPAKLEARRGPVVSCVGKKKFGDNRTANAARVIALLLELAE